MTCEGAVLGSLVIACGSDPQTSGQKVLRRRSSTQVSGSTPNALSSSAPSKSQNLKVQKASNMSKVRSLLHQRAKPTEHDEFVLLWFESQLNLVLQANGRQVFRKAKTKGDVQRQFHGSVSVSWEQPTWQN